MERDVLDLIIDLYNAALDARRWNSIAPSIGAAFHSDSAIIKVQRTGGEVMLMSATDNFLAAEAEPARAAHWHRNDLWMQRSRSLGLTRVVTDDELVTPAEARRSAFYRDWLRQLEIHHALGATFATVGSAIGIIGVHRPANGARYHVEERERMAALLPHVERAVGIKRRLDGIALTGYAALEALDRLETGVVILDRTRRILHANAAAEDILRDNREIGVVRGRFRVRTRTLDAALAGLVRASIEAHGGEAMGPVPTLAVTRESKRPLVLALAPLRARLELVRCGEPRILLFLRDPELRRVHPEQLRSVFGLTAAEASVAAEIAQGYAPVEIAAVRRVGIATVRSHLKAALAKTGTNRQAELTAVVSASTMALRSGARWRKHSSDAPSPPFGGSVM